MVTGGKASCGVGKSLMSAGESAKYGGLDGKFLEARAKERVCIALLDASCRVQELPASADGFYINDSRLAAEARVGRGAGAV